MKPSGCLHKWKTQDVDWEYQEPAQSHEVNVSAYCEKCELETVFQFEVVDALDPKNMMSMEVELP